MQLSLFGDELLITAPLTLSSLRLGQSNTLRSIHSSWVGGHQSGSVEQLQLRLGLADFELPADVALQRRPNRDPLAAV